jgi:hypothetical protein
MNNLVDMIGPIIQIIKFTNETSDGNATVLVKQVLRS